MEMLNGDAKHVFFFFLKVVLSQSHSGKDDHL